MSKKVGIAPYYPKNGVLTPKSHSPTNDISKTRKMSKNSKCTKSKHTLYFKLQLSNPYNCEYRI